METPTSTTWHDREIPEALAAVSAYAEGLTDVEAKERVAKYGLNEIVHDVGPPWPAVLLRQFTSPLIYALIASAAVAFLLGEIVNASIVLAVVFLNALIGFGQEYRAGEAIGALASMLIEPATALRGGNWTTVPAEQLVPGDVVAVAPGDRIAADLRVLEGHGLRTDESTLTGESVPVGKCVSAVPTDTVLSERSSVLHAGTMVSAGTGHGLVVETGERTELGRVSGLMASVERTATPLTHSLLRLGVQITRAIAVVTVILLAVALSRGYPLADAALAGISLAVAAIPEGIPAIVTIALAIGVRRMAVRNAIVRELPAVETLGATSVVCTDKTGTLTRNEMVVRRIWTPTIEVELEGIGYSAVGRVLIAGQPLAERDDSLDGLLEAAVLANESQLSGSGEDRTVVGDPTDGALLVAADRAFFSRTALTERIPVDVLPFDSERRYMASVHKTDEGESTQTTYVKGAPEVLLEHCQPDVAARALKAVARFAEEGLRVLALFRIDGNHTDSGEWAQDAELLGLAAMIDPPRTGVAESIEAFGSAGVEVKMITGDHPGTAAAIGRELGIIGHSPALTGPEIERLDDAALIDRVGSTAVFARVAPEHKLRLVSALQSRGAIVAMTGDGVNDAPALRQADIGVAMGVMGTAAAKEASDIVLADDNFATIRSAIEEGRRVYDNLVKAIAFALPTNIGEGLVIVVAILFFPVIDGHPILPIEPVQILWINLVATVSLALPLAFESMEPGLMRHKPRDPNEPLLSRFVLVRTIYVGILMSAVAVGLFLASLTWTGEALSGATVPSGTSVAAAQTLAVTGLMFFQVFYLLMCRTLKQPTSAIGWGSNRYVFIGIGTVMLLQLGFVHLPVMNDIFGTSPLSLFEWFAAAAAGLVVVPLVTIEKRVRRRT